MERIQPDPIRKRIAELQKIDNEIHYLKGRIKGAETFLKLFKDQVGKNELDIQFSVHTDDDYIDNYGTSIVFSEEVANFLVPLIHNSINFWQQRIDILMKSI